MSISREQRFWQHVNKNGPLHPVLGTQCWEWTMSRQKKGHGAFVTPTTNLAHRYSWELHFGPIPDGLCVLHRCDNPPCVRPDHLFMGTKGDNSRDMWSKGREVRYWALRTHCSKGHEYTPENTRITASGGRVCRACKLLFHHKYLSEKREPPQHGTVTAYNNYGCRCSECKKALRDAWHRRNPNRAKRIA